MGLLAVPGQPLGRPQLGHDSNELIKTFHNDGELYKICRILMYKMARGPGVDRWRNWHTRTAQDRIPNGLWVRVPPGPPILTNIMKDKKAHSPPPAISNRKARHDYHDPGNL